MAIESNFSLGNGADGGSAYNYTLVVQIPVPAITVNFGLTGDFILPALAQTGIPQAVQWVIENGAEIFQEVIDVATELILAVPEIVVSIQVRIGLVAVINVQLVAQKEVFDVPIPSFVLALPNIAIGPNIDLSALIPTPPPLVIGVPIPVPRVAFPVAGVTGGNVAVDGSISASASNKPSAIANPVKLPAI